MLLSWTSIVTYSVQMYMDNNCGFRLYSYIVFEHYNVH